jgi:hypothetical protein
MQRFNNKIRQPSKQPKPVLRSVPVDSVTYGRDITHKDHVWVAYTPDGVTLVAVAATAGEARRKYYQAQRTPVKNVDS